MVSANNFSADTTDMWTDWNKESGMFGHGALSDNGFQKSWMCLMVALNGCVTFQKLRHKTPNDLVDKHCAKNAINHHANLPLEMYSFTL